MADCIIVGGGLIGMLTARELRLAGADPVVIEKGTLGGESTWAGGGILSPLYPWRYDDSVNRLAKYSQSIYQDLAKQLKMESGIDPEYITSGLLVLDESDQPDAVAWARQWDMQLEILKTNALLRSEPSLGALVSQGMLLPDIAQLRNPRLAKALKGSMAYHKIPYYEHHAVTGLHIEAGKVTGVATAHKDFKADNVIIAGGAWSSGIIRKYAAAPVIEPVKGQMIIFKAEPGLIRHIILYKNRYLIPRRDGRILAGSTLEYTGFDKQTSDQALQALKSAAVDLVPALQDFPVEHHWSGLRPGTPQGIPYICRHPELDGLYINSGHFRNGVVLGAASCRLMSDLIVGRPADISMEPYRYEAVH